jgi:hypothetical protein
MDEFVVSYLQCMSAIQTVVLIQYYSQINCSAMQSEGKQNFLYLFAIDMIYLSTAV